MDIPHQLEHDYPPETQIGRSTHQIGPYWIYIGLKYLQVNENKIRILSYFRGDPMLVYQLLVLIGSFWLIIGAAGSILVCE
ncbi:hypothetical protein A3843_00655 [Pseudovibrio exalbescens]|uniref:Uncharacterized protein n=1 Tax=Pseudovibrio exalbescens TaxID=197461 RepID=A0A1U7JC44_9HYPH|nr:hypothetical protein A3843_00655 [Pseudovibrio exalbescens]